MQPYLNLLSKEFALRMEVRRWSSGQRNTVRNGLLNLVIVSCSLALMELEFGVL